MEGRRRCTPDYGNPYTANVTSNVYCGDGDVPFEVAFSRVLGASRAVAVTCPPGTAVLAGGFASPGGALLISALERVAADRWRVEASLPYPEGTILTATAYCGDGPPPMVVQSRVKLRGVGGRSTVATCPPGRSLVFGGARTTVKRSKFPSSDWHGISRMSAPTPTRWSAAGILPSAGRGTITALAYCR